MTQDLEILQGTIQAVVYQNYDNGYSVLRLNIGESQPVTVVGTIPLPASQFQSYLSGRIIKGIGPKSAARIVGHFGEKSLEIMEREPERLAEVSGISPQRARQIGEEFRVQVGMRQLMEFFTAHQLPAELAQGGY